ncbi:MAG: NAD(P)/FAD-dependent oxidoreductase [Oscillospiraceae bacterium]
MALIISQIKTTLDEAKDNAVSKALSLLCVSRKDVKEARLYKTSVDARRDVCFVHSVYVELNSPSLEKKLAAKHNNVRLYENAQPEIHFGSETLDGDIYIAGFGPAGMFCALTLCEHGYKPVVLERGAAMDERIAAVERYWGTGALDPATNVQFGEGGAGTFSDGKLTTRIGDPLCSRVLEKLCEFGAPEEILTKAKPHIGTDKLRSVVKRLRSKITEYGAEVRFLSPLENIRTESGKISSITVNGENERCGALVLAIGHSAHDTFGMLLQNGIQLVPKPFSIGARIEHLQSDIDSALYGKFAGHPALPPAEYQLSYREGERGVYTFCMCPGGYVVASASSGGTIVTNGMSYFDRAGENANSAVLVSVTPDDFGTHPLAGAEFIHRLEQRAFQLGGGSGKAPAMLTHEFVSGADSLTVGRVTPTYPLGVTSTDLRQLFPDFVSDIMVRGLKYFDRRISGFSDSGSILTAIETRSSSPVRIPRGEAGFSSDVQNLFPCGEGAGYAGGIMSAAVDGIRTALRIMEKYSPNKQQ